METLTVSVVRLVTRSAGEVQQAERKMAEIINTECSVMLIFLPNLAHHSPEGALATEG